MNILSFTLSLSGFLACQDKTEDTSQNLAKDTAQSPTDDTDQNPTPDTDQNNTADTGDTNAEDSNVDTSGSTTDDTTSSASEDSGQEGTEDTAQEGNTDGIEDSGSSSSEDSGQEVTEDTASTLPTIDVYEVRNGGFEDDFSDWDIYPTSLNNYMIVTSGDAIYEAAIGGNSSTVTFTAAEGSKAIKVYGTIDAATTPIYQEFEVSTAGLNLSMSAKLYVSSLDPLATGNSASIKFKAYDELYTEPPLGEATSDIIDHSSEKDTWHERNVDFEVPAGTVHLQAILEYNDSVQSGAVYFDDVSLLSQ